MGELAAKASCEAGCSDDGGARASCEAGCSNGAGATSPPPQHHIGRRGAGTPVPRAIATGAGRPPKGSLDLESRTAGVLRIGSCRSALGEQKASIGVPDIRRYLYTPALSPRMWYAFKGSCHETWGSNLQTLPISGPNFYTQYLY